MANSIEWCSDNQEIDGRNGCSSDEECLKIGRKKCDTDPNCYGIAWYENYLEQKLRICTSRTMKAKTDGWRTMMKQGMYLVLSYETLPCYNITSVSYTHLTLPTNREV